MPDRRPASQPCTDAGRATVEEGVVILDGPDGVAVTMTADAAIGTARSLQAAADQVLGVTARQPSDGGSAAGPLGT